MGIFNWLKRGLDLDTETALPRAEDLVFESGKEEVAGLNFKTFIEVHMHWKLRLKAIASAISWL
jgi:hypothetical protein